MQLQREKQYFEFGGKVVTGLSVVAASIPIVVSAWIAKEVVTSEDAKKFGNSIIENLKTDPILGGLWRFVF